MIMSSEMLRERKKHPCGKQRRITQQQPPRLLNDPNAGQNEVNSSLLGIDLIVMLPAYIHMLP